MKLKYQISLSVDSDVREMLEEAFDVEELKTEEQMQNLINKGRYYILKAFSPENTMVAVATIGRARIADVDVNLVDYIAVDESLRGHGIGTAFVSHLKTQFHPFLCEIEIGSREAEFWTRNGLKISEGRYSWRSIPGKEYGVALYSEYPLPITELDGEELRRQQKVFHKEGHEPSTYKLHFPLKLSVKRITSDSESFVDVNYDYETEVPVGAHKGAFAYRRMMHTHEGIDLYCLPGTPVYAMTDGVIVKIGGFTGEHVGYPHWHNTWAVMVKDEHGVINYGEIKPNPNLREGDPVHAGDLIGEVLTVLKKDKGRPMTMLHLEALDIDATEFVSWEPATRERPSKLQDATTLVLAALAQVNHIV